MKIRSKVTYLRFQFVFTKPSVSPILGVWALLLHSLSFLTIFLGLLGSSDKLIRGQLGSQITWNLRNPLRDK